MSHEKRPPPLPRTEPSIHIVRPEQPTTKQIPAVQVPANQLDAVLSEVRLLRGDVQLTNGQLESFGTRLTSLEGRLDEVRTRNSDRAKHGSQHDMQQDAVIAQVLVKQSELETKLDANSMATAEIKRVVVDEVKGFFKEHPQLTSAIVNFITVSLGAGAMWLASRGH